MWLPRPRILYSTIFVWLSITGGRFTAPFLEHQAGFSDAWIGTTLAVQVWIVSVLGSLGGAWADSRERLYKGRGRSQVLMFGIVSGCLLTLCHGVVSNSIGHFVLRCAYAGASAFVLPVVDGLTLAHLEESTSMDTTNFGQERMYGAIGWAVAHMVLGPCLDVFGFWVIYPCTVASGILVCISIEVYARGRQNAARSIRKRRSDLKNEQDEDTISVTEEESNDDDDKNVTDETEASMVSSFALAQSMMKSVYGAGFLISVVCLSSGMEVVNSLIFLFLEVLGSSNTLCGLTVGLTVLFEIPIFYVAPYLLRRLGPGNLIHIASVSYIVRVMGYTLIPSARYVLLLEPLHGVTYACARTGAVEFAARFMPPGYEASGQGLMGMVQGLGGTAGLLLGGMAEERLGARWMYRMFALIVSVGVGVLGLSSFCGRGRVSGVTIVPQDEEACNEVELKGGSGCSDTVLEESSSDAE